MIAPQRAGLLVCYYWLDQPVCAFITSKMKITGRFSEEGGGRPIEEGFRDGDGGPADGTAAIFPIIQMRDEGPWVPIGTGFFISNNGLFATAKHVVLDERGQLIPALAGVHLLRKENRVIVREAKKIVVHSRADVAIGFLFDREFAAGRAQTINRCFALTRTFPELGSKVVTMAFPKSELTTDQGNFTLKFANQHSPGRLRHITQWVGTRSCSPDAASRPTWTLVPVRAAVQLHSERVVSSG